MRRAAALIRVLVTGASGVWLSGCSHTVRPPAPVAVVRRYLAAFARQDAAAVCGTFSPQLRRYVVHFEPDRGAPATCAAHLAASHFSAGAPGAKVRRITVLHAAADPADAVGDLAVRLRLRYRSTCFDGFVAVSHCHPRVGVYDDIVWLQRIAGRWQIAKPGVIYKDTSSFVTFDQPGLPPATPASANTRAALPAPPIPCPRGGASAALPPSRLQPGSATPDAHSIAASAAPWLEITHVSVVRPARLSLCATITLAAPPRNDTSYAVNVSQTKGDVSLEDYLELGIDGIGGLHPQLSGEKDPGRTAQSACPTAYGLAGDRLELLVSINDRGFDPRRPLQVQVSTDSGQIGEPMMAHPLNAIDSAPPLTLPGTAAVLPRCAAIPAGG